MAENRFVKGPNTRTPFGKKVYLGSTEGMQFEGYTVSNGAVPTETVDGVATKILQPGTVMARITAATSELNKIGVFDTGASDGRQTKANIVGVVDTFVPWTLNERDVDVAVLTHGTVVAEHCYGYTATVKTSLADQIVANTVAGTDFRTSFMDITLRRASTEIVTSP